jgi:hypothetical protein
VNRYRFMSSFIPTTSSWYFTAVTVEANGATPIGHLWVGGASTPGVLTDVAPTSRDVSGGSPAATPNVTSAPFIVGSGAGHTYTQQCSHAGLLIYDHVLSYWEVQTLYHALKIKMAERGISLQ